MFDNKSVLITGATGSFGKRFVTRLLHEHNPSRIVIFSRDELKQFEMQQKINSPKLRYFLGDVRDKERLHRAFQGVEIVIHAAAMKQVPASEPSLLLPQKVCHQPFCARLSQSFSDREREGRVIQFLGLYPRH